jgi:hypothetical protein
MGISISHPFKSNLKAVFPIKGKYQTRVVITMTDINQEKAFASD